MVILGQNTILTFSKLALQVDPVKYLYLKVFNFSKYKCFFFKSGNLVSLRGNIYYFHGYSSDTYKMLPVYQIFENGTSLELPFDPPFEKELAQDHKLFGLDNPIKTALYYRRFYTKMN